jgi:glycosyltransferase involved in cell wall biosynthesis
MTEPVDREERITYLVANHNQGRYVRDCLTSLVAQTSGAWLAVIVDDGSTDDSMSVIRSVADPRMRVLQNSTNVGYIATLERMFEEATTDIVGILDADDALVPETTARLLEAYATDPEAGFVYSRFGLFDETLTTCRAEYGLRLPPRGNALLDGPIGHVLSFRRSIYRRSAGLDRSMLYAEDRDLVYKLEEVIRPVFVDAMLYRYREVPHSQSHEPTKRETGLRNVLRARRAALVRRDVRGVLRLCWETWAYFDYLAASRRRSNLVRTVASKLANLAAVLIRASSRLRDSSTSAEAGRESPLPSETTWR